jgi:uncharacterized protein (TIGR03032 family)
MTRTARKSLADQWEWHSSLWRTPLQVINSWPDASLVAAELLESVETGEWWALLERLDITLLVTREYEHLLLALAVVDGRPHVSYLPIPHPSGVVVDWERRRVIVASTRNPNQVFELAPVPAVLPNRGIDRKAVEGRPLIPITSRVLPGALYLHDLAIIGSVLHGNAVGENAIVRLPPNGGHEEVWWPRCIEEQGGPALNANYIQLNSIAAGDSLATSFFSASGDHISSRRPGHLNYPVDRRGVLFSGRTREVAVQGLTRPHSARLRGDKVWVDNSGYGELVVADPKDGSVEVVTGLPGWTRGLAFCGNVGFVGTSRVIPRYSRYAPGLTATDSTCAVHALDIGTGKMLGSLAWPSGNQIFALDWIPLSWSHGLPFSVPQRRGGGRSGALFYGFSMPVGRVHEEGGLQHG